MAALKFLRAMSMNHLGGGMAGCKAIADKQKDATPVVIGWIIGKARGVAYGNSQSDTPSMALRGIWEGTPADADLPQLFSEAFFPPAEISALVASVLEIDEDKRPKAVPKKGEAVVVDGRTLVPMRFEVSLVKMGDSPVGYKLECDLHDDIRTVDALADLRKGMPAAMVERSTKTLELTAAKDVKQIAGPKGSAKRKSK